MMYVLQFKPDLINDMDHMGISGTGYSSICYLKPNKVIYN